MVPEGASERDEIDAFVFEDDGASVDNDGGERGNESDRCGSCGGSTTDQFDDELMDVMDILKDKNVLNDNEHEDGVDSTAEGGKESPLSVP